MVCDNGAPARENSCNMWDNFRLLGFMKSGRLSPRTYSTVPNANMISIALWAILRQLTDAIDECRVKAHE